MLQSGLPRVAEGSVPQTGADKITAMEPAGTSGPDLEHLNGAQKKIVAEAIRRSFSEHQFARLLSETLDMNLDDLAASGLPWPDRVFQVVEESQKIGFGRRLIEAIEGERANTQRVKNLRDSLAQLQRLPDPTDDETARPALKAPEAADLTISSIQGRSRLRPLDGHPVLPHPKSKASVHTGGVHLSFTLAHNGMGEQSINVHGLELQLLSFTPGPIQGLAYVIEGAEIQGAGVARPHIFSVALRGNKVAPATWVIDARAGKVATARSPNFFDTEEPRLLTFPRDRSDIEQVHVTVLAREIGLYEFRFLFDYSVGGVDRHHASDALLVYFDE